MRPQHWKEVATRAADQHGLVTGQQVRAAGASARTLARAITDGLLVPVRRAVFAVAGAPPSVWRDLMAAYLVADGSAVVSHRAAAGLHGFPGILPGGVDVLRLDRPLQLDGVRCHRTTVPFDDDTVIVNHFRATSPARTIVDLAGELHPVLLATIVDAAVQRRWCSVRDLERQLDRSGGHGRAGSAALRSIVSDRIGGDSALEAAWLRRLRQAGLRPPALQHQVLVPSGVLLLDFAWPDVRVGMEVDGWDVHGRRSRWDHDHDKANAYTEAGWRVLFVTSRTAPGDVVRQLRRFLS